MPLSRRTLWIGAALAILVAVIVVVAVYFRRGWRRRRLLARGAPTPPPWLRLRRANEDSVEWPRDVLDVERVDEQARIPDLAPSAAAHEPPQLFLKGPAAPLWHLLKRPEPVKIVVGREDLLNTLRAQRADQFLLQVGLADEKADLLHVCTGQAGSEACAFEPLPKDLLLPRVAEPREPGSIRSNLLKERSDTVRAAQTMDPDTSGGEVDVASLGQRLDGHLVALSFDDHDRAHVGRLRSHAHHAGMPPSGPAARERCAFSLVGRLLGRLWSAPLDHPGCTVARAAKTHTGTCGQHHLGDRWLITTPARPVRACALLPRLAPAPWPVRVPEPHAWRLDQRSRGDRPLVHARRGARGVRRLVRVAELLARAFGGRADEPLQLSSSPWPRPA
jgi:hypothetical protein